MRSNPHILLLGRSFGSWINSRSNSPASGDLIESPAHIVESILRDELSLTAMNTTSFDAVGSSVGTRPYDQWKYRKSLTEQRNSLDYVSEVCFESGICSTKDYQNNERVVALDFNEPSVTLTTADVVMDGSKPMIRARQTHVKNIFNEFYLNYGFNYGSGNYDKQLFVTASSDNLADNTRPNDDGSGATYQALCSTSQTLYNKVNRWTYNAKWIQTEAVAELYLKMMINWLAIRRWEIDATLHYTTNSLQLELMDSVYWSHTLLPVSVRSVNGFFITRIVDGGLANRFKTQMHFEMCPTVFGFGGAGYGYNYGEAGYGSAHL